MMAGVRNSSSNSRAGQMDSSNSSSNSRSKSGAASSTATGRAALPDLDSLLSEGNSQTTFRLKASSAEYDRAQSTEQRGGLTGKQAALQDIERAMAGAGMADDSSSDIDEDEGQDGRNGEVGGDEAAKEVQTIGRARGGGGGEVRANSSRIVMAAGTLPLPDSPALSSTAAARTYSSSTAGKSPAVGTANIATTTMSKTPSDGIRPTGMPHKAYEMLGGSSSPMMGSEGVSSKQSSPMLPSSSSSPNPRQRSRMSSDTGTVTKTSLRSSGSTAGAAYNSPDMPTVSSLAAAMESPKIKQQQQASLERARVPSFMSDHGSFVHVNPGNAARGVLPQPAQPTVTASNGSGRDRQASASSVIRRMTSRDYAGQASTASVNTQGLGIENEVERYASVSSGSDTHRKARKLVKGSDDTVRSARGRLSTQ